jgi:predicted DNA-binding transcriptional regulator YafY
MLKLPIDPETAHDLVDPTLGVIHPDPDGCRLEIGTDDLGWAARRVAALGLGVEVVGPPEFEEALAALGRYLVNLAES